jgi:hypothetical protein
MLIAALDDLPNGDVDVLIVLADVGRLAQPQSKAR